jgi:ATP synthase protein I
MLNIRCIRPIPGPLELFFTSTLNFVSVGEKGSAPSASEFAGIGLQFAVSIVLFVYAGQWLDRRLGTGPLFLIVGVFVGAAGSFYSMYRKLMAAQAAERAGGDGGP